MSSPVRLGPNEEGLRLSFEFLKNCRSLADSHTPSVTREACSPLSALSHRKKLQKTNNTGRVPAHPQNFSYLRYPTALLPPPVKLAGLLLHLSPIVVPLLRGIILNKRIQVGPILAMIPFGKSVPSFCSRYLAVLRLRFQTSPPQQLSPHMFFVEYLIARSRFNPYFSSFLIRFLVALFYSKQHEPTVFCFHRL